MLSVTGARARTPTVELLKETGWQTIEDRRDLQSLSLLYNIIHQEAPSYLINILENFKKAGNYELQNMNILRLPHFRLKIRRNSFLFRTINRWNNLDMKTKEIDCLSKFKQSLKPNSIQLQNPLFYYGSRLCNISHCQIRLGYSKRNYDLCVTAHVRDNSTCNCRAAVEDVTHFFFVCPLYREQRLTLLHSLNFLPEVTLEALLFGDDELNYDDNVKNFEAVHAYINSTKRIPCLSVS